MSTEHFEVFARAVRARFEEMSQGKLFVADTDRDEIWAQYLGAFPPGSDPMFRERTEHNCSCCKNFIRSVGNVVAIENGAVASIWNLDGLPEPYRTVAAAMAEYVNSLAICDAFVTPEPRYGVAENHELTEGGATLTWHHFSLIVPAQFIARDWSARRGDVRTSHAMLVRAAEELTPAALDMVVDLIDQKALYRGTEHAAAVRAFQKLQEALLTASDDRRALMAWRWAEYPAARFRNSVIGTLVQDLSDGVDLERAVRSYESKVAPENYKRPTALITKKMVGDAVATIRDLDLEPALERRHARFDDVSVDSVLFVDNHVRGLLRGGVEDLLMDEVAPEPYDHNRAEVITIDDFVERVLPNATGVQVYLDNDKLSNFASLTAPVRGDAAGLFRWGNNFAWSYEGNAADSIKERVKRAGGRVEDVTLRVSLAWYNYDDLDVHVQSPDGTHIYYGNKCGNLDVDMNAGSGHTREPVENVRWVDRLKDGVYRVWVNQYQKRESANVGFEVEIEYAGGTETLCYEKAVRHKNVVGVAKITVVGGVVQVSPSSEVTAGASPREQWGLVTQRLHRVNSVVLSPNHWGGAGVGNKHWFFILEGCKNPLPTRGIYNEFLSPNLEKHRRVFEVLGDKTKCPPVDDQMSGVGFSSTRRDVMAVVVSGPGLNKSYNIKF